jgi:hypothetical protein
VDKAVIAFAIMVGLLVMLVVAVGAVTIVTL